MRIIRISIVSALMFMLLVVVAWSFLVLFLQVVSVSVTRAEMQVKGSFSPIHLGYQTDSVCMPKPGIPLDALRPHRIGGRDLGEWLRLSGHSKSDAPDLSEMCATISKDTGMNLRVVPLSRGVTETTFPVACQESRPVIVLIAIPPDGASSLSVQWGANQDQTVSGNFKPAAIPAFGALSAKE